MTGALCATLALAIGARVQAAADPPAPRASSSKKGAKAETLGPATPPADSSPLAELKKSNATLNFANRAGIIDVGCNHAPKLLLSVRTVSAFKAL